MIDLVILWVTPILLWVLVALQIADYKKRKAVSAEITKLIGLIARTHENNANPRFADTQKLENRTNERKGTNNE